LAACLVTCLVTDWSPAYHRRTPRQYTTTRRHRRRKNHLHAPAVPDKLPARRWTRSRMHCWPHDPATLRHSARSGFHASCARELQLSRDSGRTDRRSPDLLDGVGVVALSLLDRRAQLLALPKHAPRSRPKRGALLCSNTSDEPAGCSAAACGAAGSSMGGTPSRHCPRHLARLPQRRIRAAGPSPAFSHDAVADHSFAPGTAPAQGALASRRILSVPLGRLRVRANVPAEPSASRDMPRAPATRALQREAAALHQPRTSHARVIPHFSRPLPSPCNHWPCSLTTFSLWRGGLLAEHGGGCGRRAGGSHGILRPRAGPIRTGGCGGGGGERHRRPRRGSHHHHGERGAAGACVGRARGGGDVLVRRVSLL
jgi:hypothetical protein